MQRYLNEVGRKIDFIIFLVKGYSNEVGKKPSASTSGFKGYLNEVGRKHICFLTIDCTMG